MITLVTGNISHWSNEIRWNKPLLTKYFSLVQWYWEVVQPDVRKSAEYLVHYDELLQNCYCNRRVWLHFRSLQKTLNDLKDYQKKHDYWQQQNEKLMAEQVPANTKINQHVAHESLKMQQTNVEIGLWYLCNVTCIFFLCCIKSIILMMYVYLFLKLVC